MTDRTPITPEPEDYRRAAALVSHRFTRDGAGGNAVLMEAFDAQRVPELVLAQTELTAWLATHTTPPGESVTEWWSALVARFAQEENR
jgi:hypothetical protein